MSTTDYKGGASTADTDRSLSERDMLEMALSFLKWLFGLVGVLIGAVVWLVVYIYQGNHAEVENHSRLLREKPDILQMNSMEKRIIERIDKLEINMNKDISEVRTDIRELRSGRRDNTKKK